MRCFVRKSIKAGRCTNCNQYYKSIISDEVFNITSSELSNNGDVCEILDMFFEFMSKHRKIIEDDYESQFEDYRDINQEVRSKFNND